MRRPRKYAPGVKLGILFWFYKDALLCENRLRLLRRNNRGVPVFGLYGGAPDRVNEFESVLGHELDDIWAFPSEKDSEWKWRNGDLMIAQWFSERGTHLDWDAVFLAQWDMVVCAPIHRFLPPMSRGEMLISGLRPVREVEGWWQWVRGENLVEYRRFLEVVAEHHGPIADPLCCQFIAMVLPRDFLERYSTIDQPELGFLEYKVPVYAQAFGIPLVPDTCFRPFWPEEPRERPPKRTDALMHAWRSPLRLPVMLYEAKRPHGRRVFHPYRGIYPHDLKSFPELLRHSAEAG